MKKLNPLFAGMLLMATSEVLSEKKKRKFNCKIPRDPNITRILKQLERGK